MRRALFLNFLMLICISYLSGALPDDVLMGLIEKSVTLSDADRVVLSKVCKAQAHYSSRQILHEGDIPLYRAYPQLQCKLPRKKLCALPTPIDQLSELGALLGIEHLYCKRDDLSGGFDDQGKPLYGGNKVRKLEFLFAHALSLGADHLVTLGCAGSNHAAATAFWAQRESQVASCTLFLIPQPSSQVVRYNLLLDQAVNARLQAHETREERAHALALWCADERLSTGKLPYCIPLGGSTPLGVVGFVNAAFELRDQIQQGVMPEPDYIYVAMGSGGTVAGLVLGCKAAGLKTMVKAVTVEPHDEQEVRSLIDTLIKETNELLCSADTHFPCCSNYQYEVVSSACGQEYGLLTPEAVLMQHLFFEHEQLILDGTYTAKASVGLMDDLARLRESQSVVLFWHTFSQPVISYTDFNRQLAAMSHPCQLPLPALLRRYFDEPVQPLDCLSDQY